MYLSQLAHPIQTSTPLVEMQGIQKRFGSLVANDGVDFVLYSGQIHGLLGENGAGKSTLMNILAGLYQPDEGEIRVQGSPVQLGSPRQAIQVGIGMVHQHFMLVESFTVADNIALGQTRGWLRPDPERLVAELTKLSDHYGLQIDPQRVVGSLSVGEQQRVEILKVLYRGSRVLVLDEPTAVLTPSEVEDLLQILRNLAAQGTGIVLISHKLKEILAACHQVTVLRDGRNMGTWPVQDCDEQRLAELMVGREISFSRTQAASCPTDPLLVLEQVAVTGSRGRILLADLTLHVHGGEIVGIAGVDGNGQRELEEVVTGLRRPSSGSMRVQGILAHIPSDRYEMGMLKDFSVSENTVLRQINAFPFSRWGWLSWRAIRDFARQVVHQFQVKTASLATVAAQLSGGNAQKLVLGRELLRQPQVILAAQPTRGLDIGAIEYVHQQLLQRREGGAAILLISTELEEILRLSDRILVLYEGHILGTMTAPDWDIYQLGLWMAGHT
jgi:ABC-type uncharacterized transport system ATPase subunit